MRRVVLALLFATSAFAQAPRPDLADQLTIRSKVLGETRTAIVRLPRSYRTGASSYPVLYMTDGDIHIFHTAATIDFLVVNGRMPEAIVVAIPNTDRTRDLTPTHVEPPDPADRRLRTSGGADKFLAFIATELVPEIERSYRTQPYRVLLGHSHGGLFALHAAFTRPDLFQAWIAVSPSLAWDDGLISREASALFDRTREARGTLFVSAGAEGVENDRAFDDFQRLLKRRAPKSFEWTAMRFPDEDHGSTVLPAHHAGLKKVFESWRFRVDRNDDVRVLPSRMRDHYASLSKRVGYQVPLPEGTRNAVAYRLLQANQVDRAIELFQENVAAYPASANVHDSLGEAWETKGDLARAKEQYARAVELGAITDDPNLAVYRRNFDRVK
ncbi:MAG: alpha/beta hydrolase-fold protein [Thermoanaerobaculia bacterium]